jgi:hypothetical protein
MSKGDHSWQRYLIKEPPPRDLRKDELICRSDSLVDPVSKLLVC